LNRYSIDVFLNKNILMKLIIITSSYFKKSKPIYMLKKLFYRGGTLPEDGESQSSYCMKCKENTTHIFHKGYDRHYWKCEKCGREK
jgi:PHP family Zn ribbon phosphoesterase